MRVNDEGWLTGIKRLPSPNHDARPENSAIDLLVIHNISLPPGQFEGDAILRFFQNKLDIDEHPYFKEIADLKVSAHLLIRRNGEIIQFVSFKQRAWHAGTSCFHGRERCNDFSIGIEMEGTDDTPFTPAQYKALGDVTRSLIKHYPKLDKQRIAGHSDIAPDRKTDPGPCFDWQHYKKLIA